jgi:hypothetical protein
MRRVKGWRKSQRRVQHGFLRSLRDLLHDLHLEGRRQGGDPVSPAAAERAMPVRCGIDVFRPRFLAGDRLRDGLIERGLARSRSPRGMSPM